MPDYCGASLRSLHSLVISSVLIARASATGTSTMLARSCAAVEASIGGAGGGGVALTAGPHSASRRRSCSRLIAQTSSSTVRTSWNFASSAQVASRFSYCT